MIMIDGDTSGFRYGGLIIPFCVVVVFVLVYRVVAVVAENFHKLVVGFCTESTAASAYDT